MPEPYEPRQETFPMPPLRHAARLLACAAAFVSAAAVAQLKIGVTLSTTGPAGSLGIPEKNTIALLPKTMGGQSVEYIVLDDASDSSAAVVNTRKLVSE